MRIVLFTNKFPTLSQTFIVSKFLGLLAQEWDVHMVCLEPQTGSWIYFPQLQQRHDILERIHTGKEEDLPAVLCRLQPDLIHFEFGALAVGRMHLSTQTDCKTVVSFRGYDINFAGLETADYYREVWEKADAIHFLGGDLWRRARRRGCPEDVTRVFIPPAIDLSFFDPGQRYHEDVVGSRERPLHVLSVGRLVWKKGYEYGLQAIRYLIDQDVHCQYDIIGAGNYLDAVSYARQQLNLEKTVRIWGGQPLSQVKARMDTNDLFLHAAVSEGFGNVVLEAQAMKVPVVCTDADGLAENVADGKTGFVVPRRNPLALAEKMALLAKSPQLRQKMGEAGRIRVERYFQIDDQITAFEQFYRQVLDF